MEQQQLLVLIATRIIALYVGTPSPNELQNCEIIMISFFFY